MRLEHIKLAGLQGAITIIATGIVYLLRTPLAAQSVAFGCGVALCGTLYLGWKFVQGQKVAERGAAWAMRQAYATAVGRFALMAALLAMGMGYLKLAPLWVLAGLIGGQSAWLAVPVWMRLTSLNKIEKTR